MFPSFLKKSPSHKDAAGDPQPAVQTHVTTTNVVRMFASANRMEVVSLDAASRAARADPDKPWLVLELLLGISDPSAGLDQSGRLVLTRDSARLILREFDATQIDQLTAGKVAFDEARDALLTEILPAGHPAVPTARRAKAPESKVKPSVLRRYAARVGPWFGGAAVVVLLALTFGPRQGAQSHGAAVAAGGPLGPMQLPQMTAEGLSKMLPAAQAPMAWNSLPDSQKKVLMEAAQRVANAATSGGAKDAGPDVTTIVEGLSRATPVEQSSSLAARSNPILSPVDFKRLAGATQIRLSTGGTAFYGFVDPMCSACQDLESQLHSLDPKLNFIALPVGFQGGGRDQAAAALCAKDKVDAWHKAAQVQPVGTKPCADGYKQVDANNALFLSLGFNATPTLIAPNARIAQGSADAVQLAAWVTENLK